MNLNPQDHWSLESGLITLHVTRLGPKKLIKWGWTEGLKDMDRAGAQASPKPCAKWPSSEMDERGEYEGRGHKCAMGGR
jgi:hypothetical protein